MLSFYTLNTADVAAPQLRCIYVILCLIATEVLTPIRCSFELLFLTITDFFLRFFFLAPFLPSLPFLLLRASSSEPNRNLQWRSHELCLIVWTTIRR